MTIGYPSYVFVGERPSPRALKIGATWENGRLAGKTLRDALSAAGVDPAAATYRNLFDAQTDALRDEVLAELRELVRERIVVALGRRVAAVLRASGIPHVALTHPAARGAIRRTDRYQAHVRAVLVGGD